MFKKRKIPAAANIIRKAENETVEGSTAENDEGDDALNAALTLRMEQELRKRKHGLDEISINTGGKRNGIGGSAQEGTSMKKSSSVMAMNQNYLVRNDNGLGTSTITHEKIMENYINEKLGLNGGATSDPSKSEVANSADNLFRLPDSLKALSGTGSSVKDSVDPNDIGLGTGLEEVALPSSFKLQNIIETEELRRKLEEKREGGVGLGSASRTSSTFLNNAKNSRYQQPVQKQFGTDSKLLKKLRDQKRL